MPTPSIPRIVAALPVRSLHNGKQRLAGALTSEQRQHLVQQLTQGVLHALEQAQIIEAWAVVSGDAAVLEWAENLGSGILYEAAAGLNPALETARRWALECHADGLLVILPDLPLLTAIDLRQLIALSTPCSVVLAPDRHGTGTNALLTRPANLLPFHFGINSLQHHQRLVRNLGADLQLCSRPGFAFDLDTPADIAALRKAHPTHLLSL